MRKSRNARFYVVVGLLLGCQPTPRPDPNPPQPPDSTGCERACRVARPLGCEGWQDDDGGETCEQKCEGVQAAGAVKIDTACVERAKSCADVDAC